MNTAQEESPKVNPIHKKIIISVSILLLVAILGIALWPNKSLNQNKTATVANTSASNVSATQDSITISSDKVQDYANNNPGIPVSNIITTAPINDIKKDKSGRIWIATEKGVYSLENNEITEYSNNNGRFPFPQAECIECDNNTIYVGSLYGLCKFKSNKFYEVTSEYTLPSKVLWDIKWDGSNIWLATQKGCAFTNSEGKSAILDTTSTNNGLKDSWCINILRFSDWLAISHDKGISLWNINFPAANPRAWKNIEHAKNQISRPIQDMVFDGKNLWFATTKGLMFLTTPIDDMFNKFSSEMICYTEIHGLPSNNVTTLAAHKNIIWIGTDKGLGLFKNGQLQTITSINGEKVEGIRKLYINGDMLWIGSNRGLQFINTAMVE